MLWTDFLFYFRGNFQNANFLLRFGARLQEGRDDFRKMATSLFYFYTEIGRSVSKIPLTLAIFGALYTKGQVCMPVTLKVFKIS